MRMRNRIVWAGMAGLGLLAPVSSSNAEGIAEFYKDKRLTFIVGNAAGGDYDTWTRLISRYFPKHLPGSPTIIVQNMPGAGGIRATNHLFNVAAQDGSVLGVTSRNSSFKALAREQGVLFDPTKFNWIGSPEVTNRVCVVASNAPVRTVEELMEKELIMAGAGAGTALSTIPPMLNRFLGTKMKLVEGYKSSNDAKLAIDRGEVHGLCQSLTALQRAYGADLQNGKLRILFSMESKPIPGIDAPSIVQYTKNDQQRQVLALFSMGTELGRPMMAPPNVPADRVAALRAAYAATLQDADLKAEADKQGMVVTPTSGEQIQKMIAQLMSTPQEIRDLAGNIAGD